MLNLTGFVYRWTNKINNKWYIGSHQGSIDDGYRASGLLISKAFKKYGVENFEREILYTGENFRMEEERILVELDAENHKLSYNLKNAAIGGSFKLEKNGMYRKTHLIEARINISNSLKENYKNKPELATNHSKKMKGSGNPMYGRGHSEFTKNKIRITKNMNIEEWGFLSTGKKHSVTFKKIYNDLVKHGKEVAPRGQKVLEIENYNYVLPPYVRFTNFEDRKFNLKYVKREFLWYLRGDKFDTSITEHASLWKSLINEDGSINSNYGQYVFGEQNQFQNVVNQLRSDRDSRRATISILSADHLLSDTKDVPCTYSINFRIRENKLNMTVRMRSQDAIFGMSNDAPAFSLIHEMMFVSLREVYPNLEYGEYHHSADSFHVYERHFDMIKTLASSSSYSMILCPKISCSEEIRFLLHGDFSSIPETFAFTKWLLADLD